MDHTGSNVTSIRIGTAAAVAVALAAALLLSGCAPQAVPSAPSSTATGSAAATAAPGHMGGVEIPKVTGVVPPKPPVLTNPVMAVASYLDWTSFAYRIGNSDVASMTFSADEEVRVNSYVQLNAQKSRFIDQRLVMFKPGKVVVTGKRAIVPVREVWEYRYLALKDGAATSPTYTASYESTYTLTQAGPKRWVVDNVEATPLGEVK